MKSNNIQDILQQRNEIQKLLKEASAKSNVTTAEDELNWVAPGDKQTHLFDFTDFDSNIIKLGSLFSTAVTKTEGIDESVVRRIDRRLFQFGDIVQLEKSVLCPLLSETEKSCNDRSLYISFHAITGYDFTSEFESIYNGFNAASSTTSYANNRIVCWRALLTADSRLSDDILTEYVDYIMRVTAWEAKLACEIADATMKKRFPKLIATGKNKTGSFISTKVYIGKGGDDQLYFWVRVCPSVLSTMSNADVRDKSKGLNNSDIGEEKKFEALMKFCYYRRYPLSMAAAESLSGFSDGATSSRTRAKNIPPPPPPKVTRPNDLRLYLLCHSPAPNSGIEGVTPATPMSSTAITPRSSLVTPRTTTSLYDALDYDSSDEIDDHQVVLSANHTLGNKAAKSNEHDFYYWGAPVATDDDAQSVKSGASRSSSRSNRSRFYQYADSSSGTAVKPAPLESSSTAELLGWGENMYSSLGLSTVNNKMQFSAADSEEPSDAHATNLVHEPVNIPLPAPLLFERIKMVACSSRHTLLLTAMGFVYGCGENSEGALGTGDLISRSNFTMLLQLSKLVKKTNRAKDSDGNLLENDVDDDDEVLDPLLENQTEHKIIKISAGAGVIGAHSMALDSNGNLYGWGVPYAVGSGNLKAAMEPSLINASFPTSVGDGDNDADPSSRRPEDLLQTSNRQKRKRRKLDDSFVVDVSCGSCFTVAVMKSGVVASWGMWSFGRLGLGPIPYINDGKRNISVSKKSKKIAKYKLRPAYIEHLRGIAKVSCGEAHVLCMTEGGELYTWGRNNHGQLGIGCSVSGYLIDLYTPLKVPQFSHRRGAKGMARNPSELSLSSHATTPSEAQAGHKADSTSVAVRDICCGSTHSLVLDSNNDVWSWGHCGHPCLGHGDSGIEGAWSSRINGIFSGSNQSGSRNNGSRIMIPYELVPWCQEWSQPRKLLSMYEVNVVGLSAGEDHSMFVSDIGQIFLCGTGPVVPPFITNSFMHKPKVGRSVSSPPSAAGGSSGAAGVETIESKTGAEGENEDPYEEEEEEVAEEDVPFADRGDSTSALLRQKYAKDRFNVVSIPRCPSSSWLPTICTRRFVHIASAGHKCFVIQDEEFIVPSLTSPLLRMSREAGAALGEQGDDASTDPLGMGLDDTSVASSRFSNMSMGSTTLAARGRVDCVLISSGRVNLVHRALLAQRSGEIRDLILSETSTEEEEWMNQPTQLLMPELHRETANALVHYLYTDTLPKECLSNISLLYALAHVATNLRLNRLKVLCDNLLSTLSLIMLSNKRVANQDYEDDDESTEQAKLLEADMRKNGAEMPPTTLARDLGALIGDPQFADVRFIVEGKSIHAHRFILENRSEFFKRMFRSQMSETQHYSEPTDEQHLRMLDVTVPGTALHCLVLYSYFIPHVCICLLICSLMFFSLAGSFVGFLRLLLYMYTSTLPDGSDAALLEDLETANRFCIPSMKILCENMLYPTKSNWKDLLYIAEALDLQRVKLEVLVYLRDNFDILVSFDHDIFTQLGEEFPGLLSTILEMRCKSYPTPPSYKFIQHVESSKIQIEKENADLNIPWIALGSLVVFAYIYQHAVKVVSIGPLIPIINSLFLLGLLFYAYTAIRKQWKQ